MDDSKRHWRFEVVYWDAGKRERSAGRFKDAASAEKEASRLVRFGFGVLLKDHLLQTSEDVSQRPQGPTP
jgi:hypothetical protein